MGVILQGNSGSNPWSSRTLWQRMNNTESRLTRMNVDWRVHKLFPSQWSEKTEIEDISAGDLIEIHDGESISGNDDEGVYVAKTEPIKAPALGTSILIHLTEDNSWRKHEDSSKDGNIHLDTGIVIEEDDWENVGRVSPNKIEVLLQADGQTDILLTRSPEYDYIDLNTECQIIVPEPEIESITAEDVVDKLNRQLDDIDSALVADVTEIVRIPGGVAEEL
jgi:hypothetical protein